MATQSIKLDIAEGEIKNAIAVALAESFSAERRDALIREVVRAHLAYKENSYDRETILSKKVGEAIRRIAVEELDRQVEAARPEIEAAVAEKLGPQFKDTIAERVVKALRQVALSNVRISVAAEESL